MKKRIGDEIIEFVVAEEAVSSPSAIEQSRPMTLAPSTTLEDMPPVFRELALPKLPELSREDRARLLMQSPTRLFFYWSVGSNPFQRLNAALGSQTASYSLVLKLIDLRSEVESVHPAEPEGSWWFDVEADGEYRAEIGFYAPNRPYIRALFSNTVTTPRKGPSPRIASDADWAISSGRFARVLEVAGFTEDAFEVAITGDDHEAADTATRTAFADLVGESAAEVDRFAPDEMRNAMLLLAAGVALDSLRWKIGAALFAYLQKHAGSLSSERAQHVLAERFDIEVGEVEEEFGPAVFGASAVHFPKRVKATLPKLNPVSSGSF